MNPPIDNTESKTTPTKRPRRFRGLEFLIIAGGLGVALSTAAGYMGSWSWVLDLFSHFRLQYAVLLAPPVLVAVIRRRWVCLGVFVTAFVANAWLLVPLWWDPNSKANSDVSLRLLHMNVLTSNPQHEVALEWATGQTAEVIVLQEVNAAWIESIDEFATQYIRLNTQSTREDNFGMAVLVRKGVSVVSHETRHGEAEVPEVELVINVNGQDVTLLSVHTLPPVSGNYARGNRQQLDETAERVLAINGPVILVGDLNATRWSHALTRLRRGTGLRDSAQGFGFHGTWPTGLWFTGMIPIDHVLVSPEVGVVDRRMGPDQGSDHLPVLVDLSLEPVP